MRKEKETVTGQSIQAIRQRIRQIGLALKSDRALLNRAHDEIEAAINDLSRHTTTRGMQVMKARAGGNAGEG